MTNKKELKKWLVYLKQLNKYEREVIEYIQSLQEDSNTQDDTGSNPPGNPPPPPPPGGVGG